MTQPAGEGSSTEEAEKVRGRHLLVWVSSARRAVRAPIFTALHISMGVGASRMQCGGKAESSSRKSPARPWIPCWAAFTTTLAGRTWRWQL